MKLHIFAAVDADTNVLCGKGLRMHAWWGRMLVENNTVLVEPGFDLFPLPDCSVVVVPDFAALDTALYGLEGDVYVLGGAGLIAKALPRADGIFVTRVEGGGGGGEACPDVSPFDFEELVSVGMGDFDESGVRGTFWHRARRADMEKKG